MAALARLTWERHYTAIIGWPQTQYMIDRFQSAEAIAAQIADGYDYFLLEEGELAVGYYAVLPDPGSGSVLLSKLYVHPDRHRQGLGRRIIDQVEAYCVSRLITTLWLTVNKQNSGSIAFYERAGFKNAGSLVQEIGSGFVMDDYKMVKTLSPASGPIS